jgi:hypothetical protein
MFVAGTRPVPSRATKRIPAWKRTALGECLLLFRHVNGCVILLLTMAMGLAATTAYAQDLGETAAPADDSTPPRAAADPSAGDALALEEQRLADRYKRLEEVLLRMAELSGSTDPRRAALLKKAVAQSKEHLIGTQFESLVDLLKKDELSKAIHNQDDLRTDLQALLELLQSENRDKQIASEKARIRQYLAELNRIIKGQKGLQGRTQGGGDPKQLSGEQSQLAEKTRKLGSEIRRNEESASGSKGDRKEDASPKGNTEKPKDDSGKDGKSPEKPKEPDGKPDADKSKPSQGESPGESAQGQKSHGPKSEGQQSPGQGEGQSPQEEPQSDSSPPESDPQHQSGNPARKRVEAAEQRMREAEEKLRQAQRDGAVEKQEEAIRELEDAKAQLEKILRQLREEEAVRVLTVLEARVRKMLQMEREVHEGTVRLDKVPQPDRDHDHEIQANRLSGKQAEVVLEADKAMTLLREDGTAVALPEALRQVRADMQQVVELLAKDSVGGLTQGVEQDILTALEEMIAALQKAMRDRDQKAPPPSAPGDSQDSPLVDQLGELKTIRSLQLRVNLRTERYSKLIDGEQADKPDLLKALTELAERQQRVFRITRDLEQGKNR